MVEVYRNGTAVQIKVDNTTVLSSTFGDELDITEVGPFYIGSYLGTGAYFKGDMAEIILYKKALQTTERKSISCYLSDKYNLGLSGC